MATIAKNVERNRSIYEDIERGIGVAQIRYIHREIEVRKQGEAHRKAMRQKAMRPEDV